MSTNDQKLLASLKELLLSDNYNDIKQAIHLLSGVSGGWDALLDGISLSREISCWTSQINPNSGWQTIPCNEFFSYTPESRYALFAVINAAPSGCTAAIDIRNGLQKLELLSCSSFPDLIPFTCLTHLTALTISGAKLVSDLTPLSGLSNLEYLNLNDGESLMDISPIQSMHSLSDLSLCNCNNLIEKHFRSFMKACNKPYDTDSRHSVILGRVSSINTSSPEARNALKVFLKISYASRTWSFFGFFRDLPGISDLANTDWSVLLRKAAAEVYIIASDSFDEENGSVTLRNGELMAAFILLKQILDIYYDIDSDLITEINGNVIYWLDENFEKINSGIDSYEDLQSIAYALWMGYVGKIYIGDFYGFKALSRFVEKCPENKIDDSLILWMLHLHGEYLDDKELTSIIKTACLKGAVFEEIIFDEPDKAEDYYEGALYLEESGNILIFDDDFSEGRNLSELIGGLNGIKSMIFTIKDETPIEPYLPAFLDKILSGYLPDIEQITLEDSSSSSDLSPIGAESILSTWLGWIAMSGVYESVPTLTRLIIKQEESMIYEGEELTNFLKSCSNL
jgi:hypothetical protein